MRRVMARYEVVFDELVRQVSTHCVERGHCLARVWSQLSSACAAFAAHEAAQRRQLQRLQAQLHSATEQLAKQGEAKAGLIVQKAVLEGRLQWGTALSRVTRSVLLQIIAHQYGPPSNATAHGVNSQRNPLYVSSTALPPPAST